MNIELNSMSDVSFRNMKLHSKCYDEQIKHYGLVQFKDRLDSILNREPIYSRFSCFYHKAVERGGL